MLNDPTKTCRDFHIINDDIIQVEWEHSEGFETDSMVTSDIHATLTTAYARLKLYDLLEALQGRVLYFDTGE